MVADAILRLVRKVRMAWTIDVFEIVVVCAVLLSVADAETDGRAEGHAVHDSGEKFHLVGLVAGRD